MTLLSYSLQAGLGLALTYLFYRVCLVRLTFYKANRLYLSTAILLCLLAPLMDTSGLWPQKVERFTVYVQGNPGPEMPVAAAPTAAPSHHLPLLEYVLFAGMVLMVLRLSIQVISLTRLRFKAVPAGERGRIRLFLLPYPLAPFSFGHSIFFHPSAQTSADFHRIVDHETAHIEQRHTLDILLSQVLLVLQWWNPFAWLMDRSIRQNLEFLADQAVLDNGADPKQYQYLLLKVSGVGVPVLSNPFNFSPLYNRIAMMNKRRSGTKQGARFLFALPLLLLLLIAASRHRVPKTGDDHTYRLYAFVVDGATLKPLADADVKDDVSGLSTKTGADGFFRLTFPVPPGKTDTMKFHVVVSKDGYDHFQDKFQVPLANLGINPKFNSDLQLIGLAGSGPDRRSFSNSHMAMPSEEEALHNEGSPSREEIFDKLIQRQKQQREVEAVFAASPDQIYFVISNQTYVVMHGGWASQEGTVHTILVDGKIRMTGEELNKTYKRNQLSGYCSTLPASKAKEKYGIDEDIFVVGLNK
ncbi:M56 family metallopeptidase [Dinghuibacter silviterrae]|uniref:BlaR1 peptidase M56 n=1 Tax=Dinghuibacter silviterrae TaxID=1539049 RepID=A0A4R8DF61_9BACT|nr:M56 family metallopeptidase [Dinghuibacter silviterrae]TDW96057.1 BlaR1 peptidase M56 [Dinghuibacter silviterrae]